MEHFLTRKDSRNPYFLCAEMSKTRGDFRMHLKHDVGNEKITGANQGHVSCCMQYKLRVNEFFSIPVENKQCSIVDISLNMFSISILFGKTVRNVKNH